MIRPQFNASFLCHFCSADELCQHFICRSCIFLILKFPFVFLFLVPVSLLRFPLLSMQAGALSLTGHSHGRSSYWLSDALGCVNTGVGTVLQVFHVPCFLKGSGQQGSGLHAQSCLLPVPMCTVSPEWAQGSGSLSQLPFPPFLLCISCGQRRWWCFSCSFCTNSCGLPGRSI